MADDEVHTSRVTEECRAMLEMGLPMGDVEHYMLDNLHVDGEHVEKEVRRVYHDVRDASCTI